MLIYYLLWVTLQIARTCFSFITAPWRTGYTYKIDIYLDWHKALAESEVRERDDGYLIYDGQNFDAFAVGCPNMNSFKDSL